MSGIQREQSAPESMTAEEASREVLTWEAARGRLRGNDEYWDAFLDFLRTLPKYDSMVPTDAEIAERTLAIRGGGQADARPRVGPERARAAAWELWNARAGRDTTHVGFRERKAGLDARIAELLSGDAQDGYGSVITRVGIIARVRIDPLGHTDFAYIEQETSPLSDDTRRAITDLLEAHVWPMQGYPQDHAMGFSYPLQETAQTRRSSR